MSLIDRALYDQLTASLQGQPSVDHAQDNPPCPASDNLAGSAYPKLRFWMQTQYNTWTNSPEAHAEANWKLAYLEDMNGIMVSKDSIKAIQKAMRAGWIELVKKELAPNSWSKICTSAQDLYHTIIEKSFPIFKLAHKGWKLDYLCATDYPGWIRNNVNETGRWLITSGNKGMKNENDGQKIVFTGSRKQKVKRSASGPEGASRKRFKVDTNLDMSSLLFGDDAYDYNFPASTTSKSNSVSTPPLPCSLSGPVSLPASPVSSSSAVPHLMSVPRIFKVVSHAIFFISHSIFIAYSNCIQLFKFNPPSPRCITYSSI
ncbi:hypothetical protein J3R82DRAFT_8601 [Butyriboletus roseoflavus]|nr:hypothetical protein J3R82DRAFT_8601 [Butyriboletus roseoflavus]